VNDQARKRNGNLPGMGGVFNTVNLHLYHYAGNNPVKYVDPDGKTTVVIYIWNKNEFWNGIAGGTHVAVYFSNPGPSKRGDVNQPALYDPSGSYSVDHEFGTRPTKGVFYGYEDSNLENYIDFHLDQGSEVTLYMIDTTRDEEANMINTAFEQGERYVLFRTSCAQDVSGVIKHIGAKEVNMPRGIKSQMETWVKGGKAQREIRNKDIRQNIAVPNRANTDQ
jgi:hypothetical protein